MTSRQDTRPTGRDAEIAGYLTIGMAGEALQAARAALRQPTLTAAEFQNAVTALLVAPRRKRWAALVKRAHRHLSVADRQAVGLSMLRYHLSTGDYRAADRHLPTAATLASTGVVGDLLPIMEACLALGRLRKARQVANACEARLRQCQDSFEFASLIQAAAIYAARTGRWESALQLWAHAPDGEPLRCEGLISSVHVHALRALLAVREGQLKMATMKSAPSKDEIELTAPGLTREVYERTENELRWMERTLVRIVPPRVQREFGLEALGAFAPAGSDEQTQPERN